MWHSKMVDFFNLKLHQIYPRRWCNYKLFHNKLITSNYTLYSVKNSALKKKKVEVPKRIVWTSSSSHNPKASMGGSTPNSQRPQALASTKWAQQLRKWTRCCWGYQLGNTSKGAAKTRVIETLVVWRGLPSQDRFIMKKTFIHKCVFDTK